MVNLDQDKIQTAMMMKTFILHTLEITESSAYIIYFLMSFNLYNTITAQFKNHIVRQYSSNVILHICSAAQRKLMYRSLVSHMVWYLWLNYNSSINVIS